MGDLDFLFDFSRYLISSDRLSGLSLKSRDYNQQMLFSFNVTTVQSSLSSGLQSVVSAYIFTQTLLWCNEEKNKEYKE